MATIPITNSANSSPLFDDVELANILASIPESALMTTHGDQTDVAQSGGLAWKQGGMWENVNEFKKINGESTRNIPLNEAV